MFTPIKRALTALTITASLLTPISANAEKLTQAASKEALLRGRIISVNDSGRHFVIEYKGTIILCHLAVSQEYVLYICNDDQF